jgi:putative sterol carrier protein
MAGQYASVKAWFDSLPERFQASRAGSMDTVVQYDVTGEGGGQWYMTIKDKKLAVSQGVHENPKLTITLSAEDWLRVINRTGDPVYMYESGRIRLKGPEYLAEQLMYMLG